MAVAAPEVGRAFRVFGGDLVTVKITGEQTGGALTAVEIVVPPGGGPPPHVHRRESETFYVVEGRLSFTVAGESIEAGPGATLHAPKDVPHFFRNLGSEPARMFAVAQPAGFERFITAFAAIDPDAPPDFAAMAAVGAEYGIEFV